MNNPETKISPDGLIKAMQGALASSNKKIVQLTNVFDMVRHVNDAEKFKTASLSLTGEIADRLHAERVSLGIVKHDYVRLEAISHTERFERKMQVVQDLEAAMEESFEQDATVMIPPKENCTLSVRAHEHYGKENNVDCLLSVPVHSGSETVAIITCERSNQPFTDLDAAEIHLVASLTGKRLWELYQKGSWFGLRLARTVRKSLGCLFGFEHTWAKLLGILALALVLFVAIFKVPYKVSSPAILKTDKILYVSAPFDGYIESVSVKPGDVVHKGDELLRLDRKELILDEADLLAEEQNVRREIQKAQAREELADMRIQQARLAQTQAKLKTVRYKLSKSVITATADSAIIIEGDLEKKLGARVSQGSELFQMSLIENIYVEVDVNETEIENVCVHSAGELSLKSHPEQTFYFNTARIRPTATIKDQENVFPVRGEFGNSTPAWFRPGMTGVAKIHAGKKTLWWILSHQAIDYLRLKLWW